MNTAITIFRRDEYGEVRTAIINGEPLFCLSDVCKPLGLGSPHKVAARLKEFGGVTTIPTPTSSGIQPMTYINEANLYRVIFQSRKPEARKFEAWVVEEVLPSLRKTGTYTVPQAETTAIVPRSFAEALELAAKIEREREQLARENSHLSHLRLIEAPKVEACEHFLDTEGMVNIDTLSKILHDRHYIDIGPVKLFKFLREHKVIKYTVVWAGQHPLDINVPMQDYIDRGWLDLKHSSKKKIHGFEVSLPVTYVTPKGEIGIRNMLLSHGYAPSSLPKPAA
jgi:prophage antirepressor-like protein